MGPGGIDWVICGGESGPNARPMHPEWARQLRDQCTEVGIPFLFKQWGEWAPIDTPSARLGDRWMLGDTGAQHPWHPASEGAPAGRWSPIADALIRRVGKRNAGRELDGQTWDQYPKAVHDA